MSPRRRQQESPRGDVDIAGIGALLGDPRRARMLLALCANDELTAAALAAEAGLSAPASSAHLTKLLAAGLVTVSSAGRHRYYRIGGRDVVAALEALARLAPTHPVSSLRQEGRSRALHFARVCYHHLAGRLAVRIADGLIASGAVRADAPDPLGDVAWSVGDAAPEVFAGLGVCSGVPADRVPLYPCLDWSVRRPHLSGALGAALLDGLLGNGWLHRAPGQRAVRLTPPGRDGLRAVLGIDAR